MLRLVGTVGVRILKPIDVVVILVAVTHTGGTV